MIQWFLHYKPTKLGSRPSYSTVMEGFKNSNLSAELPKWQSAIKELESYLLLIHTHTLYSPHGNSTHRIIFWKLYFLLFSRRKIDIMPYPIFLMQKKNFKLFLRVLVGYHYQLLLDQQLTFVITIMLNFMNQFQDPKLFQVVIIF